MECACPKKGIRRHFGSGRELQAAYKCGHAAVLGLFHRESPVQEAMHESERLQTLRLVYGNRIHERTYPTRQVRIDMNLDISKGTSGTRTESPNGDEEEVRDAPGHRTLS